MIRRSLGVLIFLGSGVSFAAFGGVPGIGQETIPAGEDRAIETIRATIAKGVEQAFESSRDHVARRDAHAKGHGCVRATFTIDNDVPAALAAGVLAFPGRSFPAWVRFSNGAGSIQKDSKSDARGMAIKLMDVGGEKLLPDERDARTQDFIMINGPVFFTRNAIDYVSFVEATARAGSPLGFFFPTAWPGSWRLHEAINALSLTLRKVADPLTAQYWSMTPYRLGGENTAVKFSARPCAGSPKSSTYAFPSRFEDRLRDAMSAHLMWQDACFDFMVQPQTDPGRMPIEDPTIRWSEDRSPFLKVARLVIPKQVFDSPEQQDFCENLSFTPWHSLPEHRPLGGVNRARLVVYQEVSKLRHRLNGSVRSEPNP